MTMALLDGNNKNNKQLQHHIYVFNFDISARYFRYIHLMQHHAFLVF